MMKSMGGFRPSPRHRTGLDMPSVRMVSLLVIAILPITAGAKEYRVSAIARLAPVNGNTFYNGWLTTTTGPCADFKPPPRVALGEKFSENGKIHEIKVIIATQVEDDYNDGKLSIRRGEWFCAAAESLEDLGDRQNRRIWLFISKCAPLR
jgi:hypothetical protein